MAPPLYLLYLDRYHLDDTLFLQSLARLLGKAGRAAPPCILVHGSGEGAERRLEGEGLIPEREHGVLKVHAPAEVALVERAIREANQKLVGLLTDAVVAAVGVQGPDRNLLRLEDGGLAVSNAGWVADLARKGAVPIISALVRRPEDPLHAREVATGEVLLALAQAFRDAVVVLFTRTGRTGVLEGPEPRPTLSLASLPDPDLLPEPEVARSLAAAGLPLLLTSPAGLLGEKGPVGTRLVT